MSRYQARRLRELRTSQLFAMHPSDKAEALRVVRQLQLEMLRRDADRRDRAANDQEMGGSSSAPLLLGSLLAALGYEAEADHPLEIAVGLGAAVYRQYIGLAR